MQDIKSQLNSSKAPGGKTLAPQTLLRALQELANTGDGPDRVAYFLKFWAGFLEEPLEEATKGAIKLYDSPIYRTQLEILGGGKPLGPFQDIQNYVRLAWKGNEAAIGALLQLGFGKGKSNLVLPDWRRSGFRYMPRTNFQAAVYELLKHSRQARVCLNPDCASPYFIAHDPRRKFCSPECAAPFQKEWKRRWWKRKGKLWRKARKERGATVSKQSKKRGGKR